MIIMTMWAKKSGVFGAAKSLASPWHRMAAEQWAPVLGQVDESTKGGWRHQAREPEPPGAPLPRGEPAPQYPGPSLPHKKWRLKTNTEE